MSNTSQLLTFRGRLPGVVCDAALPSSGAEPLRLDVAAFVGFAERGPLDLPVALEDFGQYQTVFGHDLLLARTRLGGQVVYAALPTAVKAFFDNGGRRCYVVRVAGSNALPNHFRMPGLVSWDSDLQSFRTVITPAAWVGRWSDDMSIGTQLRSVPLHLRAKNPLTWTGAEGTDGTFGLELHLELPTTTTVGTHDLLRLHFDGPGRPLLFCFVASVVKTGNAATTTRGIPMIVKASSRPDFTFASQHSGPIPPPTLIERLTDAGWTSLTPSPVATVPTLTTTGNSEYELNFAEGENPDLEIGNLLRVTCANGDILFFPVTNVIRPQQGPHDASPPAASPPTINTAPPSASASLRLISQEAYWQFPHSSASPSPPRVMSPPTDTYGNLVEVDLLNFDLFIREGVEIQEIWQGLQFDGTQSFDTISDNYWINKLVPRPEILYSNAAQLNAAQRKVPGLDSTRSARLGEPLPVPEPSANLPQPQHLLYLPLGMGKLPGPDEFSPALTINSSCPLTKKDGLETFEPATLFLDPNLANVGVLDLINEANQLLYLNPYAQNTYLQKVHSLLMIDEIALISIPDLVQRPWRCIEPEVEPLPSPPPPPPPPDWSHFQNCHQPQVTLPGTPPPTQPDINLLPVMDDAKTYDMKDLLFVQRAIVTFCAARSDVVAILSVPLHFKRRELLDWQHRFTTGPGDFFDSGLPPGALPAFIDDTMLSYAALYHPWLQVREEVTPQKAPLRAMPPDGAICGMIAKREHARGPWIAPAHLPLLGIVGLTPTFSASDWADLFNAHINIVRQPTADYTLLSAHTLSADNQFLQISVRRLLIFLRKLALRRGRRYVFEANNERFRQAVQTSFERTLTVLLAQGAITAFQVVTGPEINTQNDYDNGRFLIALKIAPSQPIEFITVILLRAGEGLLEALEG